MLVDNAYPACNILCMLLLMMQYARIVCYEHAGTVSVSSVRLA